LVEWITSKRKPIRKWLDFGGDLNFFVDSGIWNNIKDSILQYAGHRLTNTLQCISTLFIEQIMTKFTDWWSVAQRPICQVSVAIVEDANPRFLRHSFRGAVTAEYIQDTAKPSCLCKKNLISKSMHANNPETIN